jgi:GTP-binding protein HflX
LTIAAGAKVVGKIVQQRPEPYSSLYIGKGKLEELVSIRENLDYSLVILDDELSPNQQRNLEEALKVKVIDRVALILDVFARRAHTREGRLQVELAQHQYILPRLAGQWSHLERLGGGIGTRGPGESQLETDRRMIRRKILHLQKQIEDIRKHRSLYRRRRQKSGIPILALVGYTSAGKSTLMNSLCQSDVLVDDRLFATLDPTTRRLALPQGKIILLTDTVGFIRKLPPTIVDAFRATLEELAEASLLVHVVDIASFDAAEQCQAVEEIIDELEISEKPRITALNKIDMLLDEQHNWDEKSAIDFLASRVGEGQENTTLISAIKKWGLSELLGLIESKLGKTGEA